MLRELSITLIAADRPASFHVNGPTSKLIRQIFGASFDKAMTVAKLKGARDRARREHGKCEGRKSYAERDGGQELVALGRELHHNPHSRLLSLRKVAAALAEHGYMTPANPIPCSRDEPVGTCMRTDEISLRLNHLRRTNIQVARVYSGHWDRLR